MAESHENGNGVLKGELLLGKVDAVLECVQPIYRSENFDSLKQVVP
jgi:hypothetical protein